MDGKSSTSSSGCRTTFFGGDTARLPDGRRALFKCSSAEDIMTWAWWNRSEPLRGSGKEVEIAKKANHYKNQESTRKFCFDTEPGV